MKRFISVGALLALGVVALLAAACAGDTVVHTEGSTAAGISVTGTGKAYGVPDIARLQMGVSVEAQTVDAARTAAANAQRAIVDSLRSNGVAERDIQTTQFTVEPQYDFSARVQRVIGYRVTNVVSVTVRNIDNASRVIDGAIAAGGNNALVRGISFEVSDPERLREAAREDAVRQARARAENLARLAGVDLGRPISIVEGVIQPDVPFPTLARAAAQDTATPVQPGELEITVNVTILYAINR
jgi:uncharacterized protein YggE